MKRFTHVDTMKAIGIVLVVLGHSPGLNEFAKNVIYSFHMPLFFFISGLLLSEQKLSLTYRQNLSLLWKGLGIPYLFFFLLSYLYWLPTHELAASAAKHAGISWWEPLMGVLVGNGDALFVNVVLWFFMCLLTTSLIFFAARRYFSAAFLFVAFNFSGLVFTLAYDPSWPRLPWGLDNAVVALTFYSTGHFFREYQDAVLEKTPKSMAMMLGLFMMAGVAYAAGINGEVDLNTLLFGSHRSLFLINAYLGVVALFYFSISLPTNAVFQWLSKNTIIIFPIHLLMFSVFTGVGVVVFGMPHAFKESSFLWTGLFALLALLLSYPSALFLYRFFPVVFGKRSTGIDSRKNQDNLQRISSSGISK
ncbi:acyltransferase family protein [Thiobacillus denitrificans]|nr:acyltransferase family protein [Thiobacillus denitrificans]